MMEKQFDSKYEVLILTTELSVQKTPNAICITNVISKLKELHACDITYVVPMRNNEPLFEKIDGDNVYRYKRWWIEDVIDVAQKSNHVVVKSLAINTMRFLWRLRLLFGYKNYPQYSIGKEKRANDIIKRLIAQNKYRMFLCSYNPIESVSCAEIVKKASPNTKVFVYMLDSISNRGSGKYVSPKNGMRKGMKWEERAFSCADGVLIPASHFPHYLGESFKDFRDKFYKIDYPLLEMNDSGDVEKNDNETVYCIYAGSLDTNLRNPELMLKVISSIGNLVLDLYTDGKCETVIRHYSEISHSIIHSYSYIVRKQLLKKERSADFLINIGNNATQMVPSKLFELIATGKPIIHFKNSDYDSCEEYLNRYPNSLIVDNHTAIKKVEDFIKNHRGKIIPREEIERNYKENLPEYTAKIIYEVLNED